MKRTFLLVALTFFGLACWTAAFGQTQDLSLIPPSPNAASLGKYAASPPDLSSGRISQSIPLAEIEGKSLRLPITLNYNNNGLQVKEEASWVGFGWSLSAGGSITRQVKGLPDENYNNNHRLLELFPGVVNYWGYALTSDYYGHTLASEVKFTDPDFISFQDSVHQLMIQHKTFDPEPDVFYFNLPGHSGKFIIYDDTAYTIPYQDVKIDFDITLATDPSMDRNINNFKITTADGTQYFFDEEEINYDATQDLNPTAGYQRYTSYTSAWLLTQVRSAADDDVITLTYAGGTEEIVSRQYHRTYTEAAGSPSITNGTWRFTTHYADRLSSISSSKMRVDFLVDTANARIDLETETYHGTDEARRLKRIEVYGSGNMLEYAWNLEHSYFGNSLNAEGARLKLDQVQKEGKNGADLPGYTFSYNDEGFNVSKWSYAFDHWGYFNGATNNDSAIPITLSISNVGDANRTPHPNSADKYMLSSVTYPTGGSTSYQYEANEYPDPANPYILDVLDEAVAFMGLADPADPNLYLPSEEDSIAYFQINTDESITLNRSANVWANWSSASFYYRIAIHDVNNLSVPVYSKVVTSLGDLNASITLNLDAGSYKLSVYKTRDEVSAFADIEYIWNTGVPNSGQTGPGLRVSRMETSDGTGNAPIIRRFTYNLNDYTSGTLVEDPLYSGTTILNVPHDVYLDTINGSLLYYCTYLPTTTWDWNGKNVNSGGGFFGNATYYKYVEEFRDDTGDAGKTTYQFNYLYDGLYDPETGSNVGGQILALGQEVPSTKSYLLSKKNYRKSQQDYALVSAEYYEFEGLYLDKHIIAASPTETHDRTQCTLGMTPGHVYRFDNYYYNAGWIRPSSRTEVFYYPDGGQRSVTTTYKYDSKFHRQVTSSRTDKHNGSYDVERFTYPPDYATSTEIAMTADHVISPVVEQQSWNYTSASDSILTNGLIKQYNSKYKPTHFYSISDEEPIRNLSADGVDGNGRYIYRISDSRYLAEEVRTYNITSGQVTGRSPRNGVEEGFIWSNDQNYLIAHVVNASYDEVFYESFETAGTTNPDAFSGLRSYTSSNGYTISFVPTNPSDYVVSYWIWQNGNWTYQEMAYSSQLSFNGTIDELRVVPKNARMQTMCYDAHGNVITMVDPNNQRVTYRYDEHQRLVHTIDKDGNLIRTYTYNHQN